MKLILVGLLMVAFPRWLSNNVAGAVDEEETGSARVIVLDRGDSADCGVAAITLGQGNAFTVAFSAGDDEEDEDRGGRKVVKQRVFTVVGEGKGDENRGWLGATIDEVPDALAAHLGDGLEGVMVANIITDGPAQRAGLEVHDIVVSVNGKAIGGEVRSLVKLIRGYSPGDAVELGVIRQGNEQTINVELGERPDDVFIWKMKGTPLGEIEERVHIGGKMIKRGPGGAWVFKDLGELHDLAELPQILRAIIPKSGTTSTQISETDGKKKITCRVIRHGEDTLVVEQEDEGEITVRRADQDGNETVATYADMDALREGDEEAYELFKDAGASAVIHLELDGLEGLGDLELPDIDIELDLDEWKDHFGVWQSDLEERLSRANEAYEHAMEQLDTLLEKWGDSDLPLGEDALGKLRFFSPGEGDEGRTPRLPHALHLGVPRHRFKIRDDGQIELRIHKGDSELLQVYRDEADLEKRTPKYYEKYRELMAEID